ncbi:MAG TPA: hypothetical protein VLV83_22615 [Acidobacteriota bacterium]|nr:hypothetical protein [Acidobacteriota bacterium]
MSSTGSAESTRLSGQDVVHGQPDEVRHGLERALEEPVPFHLRVDCTDKNGPRHLEVFPSGVATWDEQAQLKLEPSERTALLKMLLEGGFASFKSLYGGKGEAKGPLRVSCRIDLQMGELRKVSRQLAEGEQFPQLTGLAASLLDRVAPWAKERGVEAADLGDGLEKLGQGLLSAQALRLLFIDLPSDQGRVGQIMTIEGGRASLRDYAPGRKLGGESSRILEDSQVAALARILQGADPASMPVNLWADQPLDLRLSVLKHEKNLLARPFSRLTPDKLGQTQERFDRLIAQLREFRARLFSSPD